MSLSTRTGAAIAVSAVGVVYSGYLSYVSLFTGAGGCESYYFGLPACFYGFVIYLLTLVVGVALLLGRRNWRAGLIVAISLGGMVFSAYLTLYVLSLRSCVSLQVMGVPPCILGLAMYAVVLGLAASLASGR